MAETVTKNNSKNNKFIRTKNEFGTFGGVFTPAILTILGVIMFMRANFVVGQAGVLGAVGILLIAKSITFLTSLSIGAISTNMPVRGGGSYFLISRALGAEFGGAIGIALFFALALSVPFYILGFTEALVRSFPMLTPYFQKITLTTALILFVITYYGAGLAIKTQYIIMTFLVLSILAFLGGALQLFSVERFMTNLSAGYSAIDPQDPSGPAYSFWLIFAIYFPAVTGIDAGVNMSGDLKDPAKSIPRGTLAAIGVGFTVYLLQIILSGGAYDRESLRTLPFELLRDNALFGMGMVVIMGVVAATLSSAVGSYLGAPRVLQAVSRDRIVYFLRFFAKGAAKGDEPRRALILTLLVTVGVLLWAGNESGGATLNAVASVITMFFLYSYGMLNLAAFIEDFGGNPSFRPRFRFFHWATALLGAIGCVVVALLINWIAAISAVALIAIFLWYIKTRHLRAMFGDARRGFVYRAARKNLLRLVRTAEDSKNWRPTVLVLSGTPEAHEALITYAVWLESRRGLVYLANVLVGDFEDLIPRRSAAIKQLTNFCEEKNMEAFPVVVLAEELEEGVKMLLQSTAMGPIRPNLAVFGWPKDESHFASYLRQLRSASDLGISLVLLEAESLPRLEQRKRIDVWWRGQKNGGLMLLLAYLLTDNWEWHDAQIRVLRVVEHEAGREPATKALQELVDTARVEATVEVIVSDGKFADLFHWHSANASCVILGFEVPEPDQEEAWYNNYMQLLDGMPTTISVNSREEENLLIVD